MAHRFKVAKGGPYPHFITITVVRWLPVFVSGPYFDIILNSLKCLKENRSLSVYAYVIMPTHLHSVVMAHKDDLSSVIRDMKRFTAREIYKQSQSDGNRLLTWMFESSAKADPRLSYKVWQDEFHPEAIYSYDFFRQKVDYLHDNPVRKGLVGDAVNWYYSSAAQYADGDVGPLEVDLIEW